MAARRYCSPVKWMLIEHLLGLGYQARLRDKTQTGPRAREKKTCPWDFITAPTGIWLLPRGEQQRTEGRRSRSSLRNPYSLTASLSDSLSCPCG